jgi:hypothetical protein
MANVNQMSYRGIGKNEAGNIGMAASVAGGYVAVDGPRLHRIKKNEMKQWRDGAEVNGQDTSDLDAMHKLQSGDYVGVCDPNEHYSGNTYLILCVPAGGPLAEEGFSLPESLVNELAPMLTQAGYTIA